MNIENTVKIKISELTQARFEEYPVWTWAEASWQEDEDLVCPVLQYDPLPRDDDLFIKADIWTASGHHFIGNLGLAMGEGVYVVGFAFDGKDYTFNLHIFQQMRGIAEQMLDELRNKLGDKKVEILPLRYETKVRFAGEGFIAGVFNPHSS